jgi:ribonuclease HII
MKTTAKHRTGKPPFNGPDFELEAAAIAASDGPVAGVDEAGRGPWAGPVVAAAVILDAGAIPPGLDDSKALDHQRRESLYAALLASGAAIGIGIAAVGRIDRDNILQATFWAMQQAIAKLPQRPALALIDGNRLPKLEMPARAIISGDARCLSIAAASIVAKVTRDRLMTDLAIKHPGYGFERHKGYGTPEHKTALDSLGPCPQHRRSFRPVQFAVAKQQET